MKKRKSAGAPARSVAHERDFKKIKRKVGKKAPLKANVTSTSFATKSIHVPNQKLISVDNTSASTDVTHSASSVTNARSLNLHDLFSQLKHYSVNIRREALVGLKDLCAKHRKIVVLEAAALFQITLPCLLDEEKSVRAALLAFLGFLLPALGPTAVQPFQPLMLSYVCSGLSHMHFTVKRSALVALKMMMELERPTHASAASSSAAASSGPARVASLSLWSSHAQILPNLLACMSERVFVTRQANIATTEQLAGKGKDALASSSAMGGAGALMNGSGAQGEAGNMTNRAAMLQTIEQYLSLCPLAAPASKSSAGGAGQGRPMNNGGASGGGAAGQAGSDSAQIHASSLHSLLYPDQSTSLTSGAADMMDSSSTAAASTSVASAIHNKPVPMKYARKNAQQQKFYSAVLPTGAASAAAAAASSAPSKPASALNVFLASLLPLAIEYWLESFGLASAGASAGGASSSGGHTPKSTPSKSAPGELLANLQALLRLMRMGVEIRRGQKVEERRRELIERGGLSSSSSSSGDWTLALHADALDLPTGWAHSVRTHLFASFPFHLDLLGASVAAAQCRNEALARGVQALNAECVELMAGFLTPQTSLEGAASASAPATSSSEGGSAGRRKSLSNKQLGDSAWLARIVDYMAAAFSHLTEAAKERAEERRAGQQQHQNKRLNFGTASAKEEEVDEEEEEEDAEMKGGAAEEEADEAMEEDGEDDDEEDEDEEDEEEDDAEEQEAMPSAAELAAAAARRRSGRPTPAAGTPQRNNNNNGGRPTSLIPAGMTPQQASGRKNNNSNSSRRDSLAPSNSTGGGGGSAKMEAGSLSDLLPLLETLLPRLPFSRQEALISAFLNYYLHCHPLSNSKLACLQFFHAYLLTMQRGHTWWRNEELRRALIDEGEWAGLLGVVAAAIGNQRQMAEMKAQAAQATPMETDQAAVAYTPLLQRYYAMFDLLCSLLVNSARAFHGRYLDYDFVQPPLVAFFGSIVPEKEGGGGGASTSTTRVLPGPFWSLPLALQQQSLHLVYYLTTFSPDLVRVWMACLRDQTTDGIDEASASAASLPAPKLSLAAKHLLLAQLESRSDGFATLPAYISFVLGMIRSDLSAAGSSSAGSGTNSHLDSSLTSPLLPVACRMLRSLPCSDLLLQQSEVLLSSASSSEDSLVLDLLAPMLADCIRQGMEADTAVAVEAKLDLASCLQLFLALCPCASADSSASSSSSIPSLLLPLLPSVAWFVLSRTLTGAAVEGGALRFAPGWRETTMATTAQAQQQPWLIAFRVIRAVPSCFTGLLTLMEKNLSAAASESSSSSSSGVRASPLQVLLVLIALLQCSDLRPLFHTPAHASRLLGLARDLRSRQAAAAGGAFASQTLLAQMASEMVTQFGQQAR